MPSHSDVFAKMDALMKKHHPGIVQPQQPDAQPEPRAEVRSTADIPVLTDIFAKAEPEIPVLTEVVDLPAQPDEGRSKPEVAEAQAESHAPSITEETAITPLRSEEEGIHAPSSLKGEAGRGMGLLDAEIAEPIPAPPLPLTGWEHAADSPELAAPPVTGKGREEGENSMLPPSPLPSPPRGEGVGLGREEMGSPPPADLENRIREELVQRLTPQLAAALEKSLAGALDQFAMQIEYLIRDAIAAEVRQQLAQFRSAEKPSAKPKESAD